ncbi:hypothetical protein GGI24_000183 [Coemansia furcata]|nr:hypothetical protein GGI24_000183 [Coemansia furcata]
MLRQLAGGIEKLSPGNVAPRQLDTYPGPPPWYIMRALDGITPAYRNVVETYEQAQARARRLHSDFGLDDNLSLLTAGPRSGANIMRTQGRKRMAPHRQSQLSTQGLPMVYRAHGDSHSSFSAQRGPNDIVANARPYAMSAGSDRSMWTHAAPAVNRSAVINASSANSTPVASLAISSNTLPGTFPAIGNAPMAPAPHAAANNITTHPTSGAQSVGTSNSVTDTPPGSFPAIGMDTTVPRVPAIDISTTVTGWLPVGWTGSIHGAGGTNVMAANTHQEPRLAFAMGVTVTAPVVDAAAITTEFCRRFKTLARHFSVGRIRTDSPSSTKRVVRICTRKEPIGKVHPFTMRRARHFAARRVLRRPGLVVYKRCAITFKLRIATTAHAARRGSSQDVTSVNIIATGRFPFGCSGASQVANSANSVHVPMQQVIQGASGMSASVPAQLTSATSDSAKVLLPGTATTPGISLRPATPTAHLPAAVAPLNSNLTGLAPTAFTSQVGRSPAATPPAASKLLIAAISPVAATPPVIATPPAASTPPAAPTPLAIPPAAIPPPAIPPPAITPVGPANTFKFAITPGSSGTQTQTSGRAQHGSGQTGKRQGKNNRGHKVSDYMARVQQVLSSKPPEDTYGAYGGPERARFTGDYRNVVIQNGWVMDRRQRMGTRDATPYTLGIDRMYFALLSIAVKEACGDDDPSEMVAQMQELYLADDATIRIRYKRAARTYSLASIREVNDSAFE